ncbi:MAG: Smr/MutS family protein [Candidatus Midichloriaceae bacterium]
MDDEKYILDIDELVVWKDEIKDVKKLESQKRVDITEFNNNLSKVENRKENHIAKPIVPINKDQLSSNILKLGDPSRMNSGMHKSISKGEYKIDSKLDLHGYSIDEAYNTLVNFLNDSYQRKYRMLLIITGKGLNSPDKSSTIKESFFGWIQAWEVKDNFLYVNYAHQKHGGNGAFYVLLKKQAS